MLLDRLVFGCGRLTGGASSGEASRLVGLCLDHGVRQFDCAPSYGIGTAETVLGKILRGRSNCRVVTKIGSQRDPRGQLKSWLRAGKRLLSGATARDTASFEPNRLPPADHGRWDEPFLRDSVARSVAALGRIDGLYMHDPAPVITDEAHMALATELARGIGAAPGVAFASVWPAALTVPLPQGWEGQGAYDPDWLLGRGLPTPGVSPTLHSPFTLHSLVMTGHWLGRQNPAFAEGLARAEQLAGNQVAALFALGHARCPQARLIFASANAGRLRDVLKACAAIDDRRLHEDIAACFPASPQGA